MGILKFIIHRLLEFGVITALILYIPNLPPYTTFSESVRLPPTKNFEGKLAINRKLDNVEIWHKGHFIGPESLADFDGELYTGLYGGDIVKLSGKHITPIIKTGKPCKAHYDHHICGRPLGLRFDKRGFLYVADAYFGIMKTNIYTGEKHILISPDQEIEGRRSMFFNSVAIASDGDIFWTHTSSNFSMDNSFYEVLADPSGRLIHYNAKTKTNRVLIDKLNAANGVALSDDEAFLLVVETMNSRILRYYLKGPKNGKHDVFIDGLPGLPDNINQDGHGGFLVPLVSSVDDDHPDLGQVLLPFPAIRKLVSRIMGLTQFLFKTLDRIYPCEFAKNAVHSIGTGSVITKLLASPRTTVLHISKNGDILDSLHTTTKKIKMVSEAHIFKNTLYLGSPHEDYIARISLSKIGWEHLRRDS